MASRPVVPPVSLASTFAFDSIVEMADAVRDKHPHLYTRWSNPTVEAAEHEIAALEGADRALLTASGMSAIHIALLAALGDGPGPIVALREVYGGTHELLEAVPFDAGKLLGAGMALAVLSVVWPVLIGGRIGQSYALEAVLPLIGEIKLVTTLFFDVGVWLIIIGAMLDFVRSLGAGIDLHGEQDVAPRPEYGSDRSLPGREVQA